MRLSPYIAFLSAALLARADEPAIIAKARAYLGSEEALNGVHSVHMVGTFVSDKAGAAPASTVDIIFQKPSQHHLVVTASQTVKAGGVLTDDQRAGIAPIPSATSTVVRTIALDGYDAWERIQANADTARLSLLSTAQIRVLRADVWENLGYYRGIEAEDGSVADLGPATIDGVACEKIAFTHSATVIYYRYFDQATGRLVYTETAGGLKIREEGSQISGGIRFPQKIITTEPAPAATGVPGAPAPLPRSTTLTIDHVTVNEVFPASLFAMPLPPVPVRPPVTAPAAPAAPAAAAPAPAAPAPAGTP